MIRISLLIFLNLFFSYHTAQSASNEMQQSSREPKVIHVFVALCDNEYQGIVQVPALIGNGQDPANNLYWGAQYGFKSYFKKSNEWQFVKSFKVDSIILERMIFKNKHDNYYVVADAYNGKHIDKCITDFLKGCSNKKKESLTIGNIVLGVYGNAQLLAYIGHDGLMDFSLNESFKNIDGKGKDCIILACISKNYFKQHILDSKANPIVWTTGLMCPEAYTLHDAIEGYILNETPEQIRMRAVKAYSKYQKCSEKSAKQLLVTGY